MSDAIEAVIRRIKPPHQRSRVGVDRLIVTPPDKQGNNGLIVVLEHFTVTEYVAVYPSNDQFIHSLAMALCKDSVGVTGKLWTANFISY
jgi:hypothetical protein